MMQTGRPRPLWSGGRSGSTCGISSCVRKLGRKLGRRSPGAMEERRRGPCFLGNVKVKVFPLVCQLVGSWFDEKSYTASCWPSGKGRWECGSESFSSIILYLFSCLGIYCQCLTRAHAESTCFENIFENLASILQ